MTHPQEILFDLKFNGSDNILFFIKFNFQTSIRVKGVGSYFVSTIPIEFILFNIIVLM